MPYLLGTKRQQMKLAKIGTHNRGISQASPNLTKNSFFCSERFKRPQRQLTITGPGSEAPSNRTSVTAKSGSLAKKILDVDKGSRGYNPGGTHSTAMSATMSEPVSQHSSHVANALLSNLYGGDYAAMQREKERMRHLDANFMKKKPIFKNYIESNANIVRSNMAKKNLQGMLDSEIREMTIVKNLQRRLGE